MENIFSVSRFFRTLAVIALHNLLSAVTPCLFSLFAKVLRPPMFRHLFTHARSKWLAALPYLPCPQYAQ